MDGSDQGLNHQFANWEKTALFPKDRVFQVSDTEDVLSESETKGDLCRNSIQRVTEMKTRDPC